MTFWGVEVKPGKPFILNSKEFGGALMLTQATLGLGSSPKKSTLQVKVGDKEPIFLCTLIPEKSESFLLNLEFEEEDNVTFSVLGPTSIHLSGIVPGTDHDEDDSDFDGFGEDLETIPEGSESECEDDSEVDFLSDFDMQMLHSPAQKSGVVIEEIEDEEEPASEKGGSKLGKKNNESAKGKTKESKNNGESTSNLKRKVASLDQDQDPNSNANDSIDEDASKDKKKKKNKKKKAKIEKDGGEVAPSKQVEVKEEKKNSKEVKETKQPKDKAAAQVKICPNGLVIEELKMGKPNGRLASRGKKVSVRYIGKLKKNGKIFDSSTKPFKFPLGAGKVIKGWEVGVEGMRVGGKRRLTIPPAMGYGSEGAMPAIPPNAWLVFDVDLVDVA